MFPIESQTRDNRRLTIRQANTLDAEPILEFLNLVAGQTDFLSFGPGEFTMPTDEMEQHLSTCRETENWIQIVAHVEQRLVGTIHFQGGRRSRTAHIGELGMSVEEAFWGQGVGGALLDALIGWAEQSPVVAKLNLRVAVNNPRAKRLYESRSFVHEGLISRDMLVKGEYVDHDLMGRHV